MKKLISIIIFFLLSISILNAQHLKKNGTPDRRYKENKQTYSSPTTTSKSNTTSYSTSTSHLKKDGTPDKRYRENNPNYNTAVKRDENGKIIRSQSAIYEFKKKTGFPNGRPGYVIDHVIPLKEGGCDCPENMQWQTIENSKEKDKWE